MDDGEDVGIKRGNHVAPNSSSSGGCGAHSPEKKQGPAATPRKTRNENQIDLPKELPCRQPSRCSTPGCLSKGNTDKRYSSHSGPHLCPIRWHYGGMIDGRTMQEFLRNPQEAGGRQLQFKSEKKTCPHPGCSSLGNTNGVGQTHWTIGRCPMNVSANRDGKLGV